MDGLKKQKAIAEKQIEKIKANISGLDRTISNIEAKKGITPKTTTYIEGHLKTISEKESKIKELITKIGDIRDGMKIQYKINKEQQEREKEERKIIQEQRERDREQRKSSRPVLANRRKKPKPKPNTSTNTKPTPSKEELNLAKALSDFSSSAKIVTAPPSFNQLIDKGKKNLKKALISSSQQQQQQQRQQQPQPQRQQQPQKESKFSEERNKYRREIWIMLNKEIFGSENGISGISSSDILQFQLFKVLHEGLSHIEDTQIDNAYTELEKKKLGKPSTRELIKQILINYLKDKYKLIITSRQQCNNFIKLLEKNN